jgi:hypothetical protein
MKQMSDALFGAELLTNPQISNAPDIKMPELDSIELPTVTFDSHDPPPPPPKLFPSVNEVGPMETGDGLRNMNADQFHTFNSGVHHRMSEENVLKEKYELLRKFERLQRAGVPMRKRFTLESPLEEMKIELEFMRREKAADQTIKQFCDWYITAMSAMEWSSKNVAFAKAFGLQLDGLSESAQMNVTDMEEDFEELYDMYGDKMKMHPLVRIPIRTCMMVYMVHLTNQMARKAPIPNIDEVLRTNPDIARQLATAAMQQQTRDMKTTAPPFVTQPPPSANPLAGLQNFMSGMVPPAPQQTSVRPPTTIKTAIKYPRPNPQPPAAAAPSPPPPPPAREIKAPTVNLDDLLKQVQADSGQKKVSIATTPKRGGSTGKNSVSIKL